MAALCVSLHLYSGVSWSVLRFLKLLQNQGRGEGGEKRLSGTVPLSSWILTAEIILFTDAQVRISLPVLIIKLFLLLQYFLPEAPVRAATSLVIRI